MTRAHSTFYWAMRLMPADRRAAMFAIYDVARALDDVADGPAPREAKRATLEEWRVEIGRLYEGRPTQPLMVALAPAIERFALPREEFEQLIRGMEMDVDGPLVAPPRAVLDLYCRRVAGSVGLLTLPVFGADGRAERELALYTGRALQLTNILRDLEADAAGGRLYVPQEYLRAAGIDDCTPGNALRHPGFSRSVQDLAKDARRAYAAAEQQMTRCDRRALWPAAAMLAAYRALLDRLERAGFPASQRIAPGRLQTFGVALRAALAARF